MAWKRTVWIDDDGSLTVGTPFVAENMNNIEIGITEGLAGVAAASGMAGSALTNAASGVTAAGSALVTAQQANARAASGVTAAGSALVTGQQANARAASGVTAAGSALVTGQFAGALAASGVTAAGSALRTGQDARAAAGSALTDIVGIDNFTAASGMAFVVHMGSANIARPSGVGGVLWVGTVEPANALANDPWIDIRGVRPGPRNWGEVTELPKNPSIGDRCTFKYDPNGEQGQFNPGVLAYWDFEYDGVTPFPWKCIGGQWAQRSFASIVGATSKTFISTGAPSILTPFAEGDYDLEFGAPSVVNNVASNSGVITMKLKNEGLNEFIEGTLLLVTRLAASTSQGGFWVRGRTNIREPLAGVSLQVYYAIEAGTSVTFATPSIRLRPRRVAG